MTIKDYKQLELLLSKLGDILGHRFFIIPKIIYDGYHIGIYDENGNMKKSEVWMDLETTVKRIKTEKRIKINYI